MTSCWCLACLHCAMSGPEALSSDYVTPDCERGVCDRALYEYTNRTCRVRSGPGADAPNKRARKHGHDLAAKLSPGGGEWVLVEAYDEDADGDEVWLGRTVTSPRLDGGACQKQTMKTTLHADESRSTVFDSGDFAIAVQWYERSPIDLDRLTFAPGDGVVCVINSTELRGVVSEGGVRSLGVQGGACRGGGGPGGELMVALDRKHEAHAVDWCR